jgi:hypothetical protein
VSGVNETGGLAVVDCLSEGVVEEGVLNIQMANLERALMPEGRGTKS